MSDWRQGAGDEDGDRLAIEQVGCTSGGDPIFLGVAAIGDSRPDLVRSAA